MRLDTGEVLHEARRDGLLLSTDRSRLDLPTVVRWLSVEAYWAHGRPAATVAASVEGSVCVGVYDGSQQVAFARVVTDGATFGWLCDVVVADDHRGRGIGGWLVAETVAHLEAYGVPRLLLATRDAHQVYRRSGFTELAVPDRWMERDRRRPS